LFFIKFNLWHFCTAWKKWAWQEGWRGGKLRCALCTALETFPEHFFTVQVCVCVGVCGIKIYLYDIFYMHRGKGRKMAIFAQQKSKREDFDKFNALHIKTKSCLAKNEL